MAHNLAQPKLRADASLNLQAWELQILNMDDLLANEDLMQYLGEGEREVTLHPIAKHLILVCCSLGSCLPKMLNLR